MILILILQYKYNNTNNYTATARYVYDIENTEYTHIFTDKLHSFRLLIQKLQANLGELVTCHSGVIRG